MFDYRYLHSFKSVTVQCDSFTLATTCDIDVSLHRDRCPLQSDFLLDPTTDVIDQMSQATELDEDIGLLAAQIHSLSAQLIQKLGELDACEGWQRDGYRTLTQWLSVRCKFTTQEAARFARLAIKHNELSSLLDHGQAGRLSPGVIEQAGRATTPDNADEVADAAVQLTPAQGQRFFSKMRREQEFAAHNPEPSFDDDGNEIPTPPPPRLEFWWREWTDELGRGRIDAALDPLIAAQISTAWEASRRQGHRLDLLAKKAAAERARLAKAAAENACTGQSDTADPHGAAEAVDPVVAEPADPIVDHDDVRDPDVATTNETNDDDLPGFNIAPWNDVNQIAGIFAETVIKELESTGLTRIGGSRFHVQVTADIDTIADALGIDFTSNKNAVVRLGREAFDAHSGRNLTKAELARVSCEADMSLLIHKDGRPLWLSNTVHNASQFQRRALLYRSRGSSPTGAGCCEVPGCTNNRYVEAHHVQFHEHGGASTLDNYVLLCSWHHDELHANRVSVTANGNQRFTFYSGQGRRVGTNISSLNDLADLDDCCPDAELTDLPPPDAAPLPQHVNSDAPRSNFPNTPLNKASFNKLFNDLLCA